MNIFFSTLSIPAFALLCSWSDKDGLEENLARLLEQGARDLKQQSEFLCDQAPDLGKEAAGPRIRAQFQAVFRRLAGWKPEL